MKTKSLFKAATTFVVTLCAAAFMQSCSDVKEVTQTELEGYWVLASLNDKKSSDVFAGAVPTLEFNFADSLVSGTDGCNRYTGKFSYEKGIFNAPILAQTQMLCVEDNLAPEFMTALSNLNNTFKINNDTLEVIFEKRVTLKFIKGEAPSANVMMEPTKENLAGVWTLNLLDGVKATEKFKENAPTITFDFDNNKVSGIDGCNNYNATFTLDKNNLVLGPIMSTRMACPDMEAVNQFTAAISDSTVISVPNSNVLQVAKNGVMILEFEKK